MSEAQIKENSSAACIAKFLKHRGVKRVYALCGGHIMPMWMRLDAEGIQIIDVRDERAAVYMAHAEALLTGQLGVALVTAGPGVTNAMTGIANAHISRAPVLVLSGLPPTQQENRGALQDIVHIDLLKSITRYARTVRESSLVLKELDEAVACAMGEGCEAGPAYLDFPVNTLRAEVPEVLMLKEHLLPKPEKRLLADSELALQAVAMIRQAKRPLLISGRGARGASAELDVFLKAFGVAYLDTGETKGQLPDTHPNAVAAMRGVAMQDADLIITVGRKLDFQLGYGSPAVLKQAKFIRIADTHAELRDNRRGEVELLATPALALQAMSALANEQDARLDRTWLEELQASHRKRSEKLLTTMKEAPDGSDGLMHPNKLVYALRQAMPENSLLVADGGDFLSFARVGLPAKDYLDPGPLGCIGIGTAFGLAASLVRPEQPVFVATGDGAFGFNCMEMDTAVRHKAPVMITVANNGSWAIEVRDQAETHGKVVGTYLRFSDYAAMARALGMYAERVEKAEDLPAAIERCMVNRPSLLDVLITPEAASSDAKSGLAWVPDLQPLGVWNDAEKAWRSQ